MQAVLFLLLVGADQVPPREVAPAAPPPQAFIIVVQPLPGVPASVTPSSPSGERWASRPPVTEGRGDGVEMVCGRGGLRARVDLQFGGRGYGYVPYGYGPPAWSPSPYGYGPPAWSPSPYGYGNGYGNGHGGFDLSGQFGYGSPGWGRGSG